MPRLTKARKTEFLRVLRETGIVRRAAAAASPHGKGSFQTFYDERQRNPEFAAEWDSALDAAIGDVEAALRQSAMEGDVFEKFNSEGVLVSRQVRRPDVKAIQMFLSARCPEYRQQRVVEAKVDADVKVETKTAPADLSNLNDDELAQLERLVAKGLAK